MATKPRGGGAKGLSGRATKKGTFFAASLRYMNYVLNYRFDLKIEIKIQVQSMNRMRQPSINPNQPG